MSQDPLTNSIRHEVQPGETLSGIAKQSGLALSALLDANPDIGDPNQIRVGQTILIPSAQASSVKHGVSAAAQPALAPSSPTVGDEASGAASPNALLDLFESAGASAKTAKQDHLQGGVSASEAMAKADRARVMHHKEKFEEAARTFHLPPALLAAIASRESRGGAVLDSKGEGDGGHGFGLMQVDDRNPFPVAREGGPAGQPHINQATRILHDKVDAVKQKFPNLSLVAQLQTAVSRYNGGHDLPAPNSDQGTTGGDYMNDVWARARFYARVEEWH
jgi:LysM repeat protein